MRKILFTFIMITIMALTGCSQAEVNQPVENVEPGKLVVVTSLFPLYEFAKEVGGDKVEVTLLLPPGSEPHAFEPKPSDIIKIENADVFLYIGEIMEPWAHDILEASTNDKLKVVDASSLVTLLENGHHDEEEHNEREDEHDEHEEEHNEREDEHDEHEEEHNEHEEKHDEHEEEHNEHEDEHHHHRGADPHIWLNLENDQIIVKEIAEVFSLLDKVNAAYYTANAGAYITTLQALDKRYYDELSSCNKDEFLVGGHNFFGYIEERYSIEGIPTVENFAPRTEPTPKQMQKITEVAKEHDIRYILTEVVVSAQTAEAIATEVGAEVLTFHPVPNLPKEDFEKGVTFVSAMEDNLETLKIALECTND